MKNDELRCSAMHQDQWVFRELLESDAYDLNARSVCWRVLMPWAEAHSSERDWFRAFGARTGDPVPPAEIEDLWRLYAMSRVNETLLLRFQQGRADGTDYQGPDISLTDYRQFMEALGFEITSHPKFHPFFHEIVEVQQLPDDDAPIELIGEYWPCVMLGPMMFSRAGVWVQGGKRHINKTVAESSTIYWAYHRKNRRYEDLSQGWGSNSQWRTRFRRDYLLNGVCHFNVDAQPVIGVGGRGHPDERLTPAEQLELMIHRHFIITDKPHEDLWPYDTTCTMPLA